MREMSRQGRTRGPPNANDLNRCHYWWNNSPVGHYYIKTTQI